MTPYQSNACLIFTYASSAVITNDACEYDDIVDTHMNSSVDFNYSEVGVPNEYSSVPAFPSELPYEAPIGSQAKVCNMRICDTLLYAKVEYICIVSRVLKLN